MYSTRIYQLRRWATRQVAVRRALLYFAGYAAWITTCKFISLTFITYFVLAAGSHTAHFEDVNDAYGASALPTLAFGSLSFVLLERLLDPLRSNSAARELFSPQRFEKRFLPGFLHGGVLASGVILAFLFSGIYRYLGFFVHFDETPFALAAIALRVASVGVLAYCEEYIFRGRILKMFAGSDFPPGSTNLLSLDPLDSDPQARRITRQLTAVGAASIFYLIVKLIQFTPGFDLSWMSGLTLFLVSINLGVRACFVEGELGSPTRFDEGELGSPTRFDEGELGSPTRLDIDFTYGAGFWASVLIVFHPLMSLPIFGSEFAGLILIKYQPTTALMGGDIALFASETTRFFTGGAGGPLASFAFQILMAFDIARNALRYKKVMTHSSLSAPMQDRLVVREP